MCLKYISHFYFIYFKIKQCYISVISQLNWKKKSIFKLENFKNSSNILRGFPGGSVIKNLPANVRDTGSVPELRRSPGEGDGNPL